MRAEGGPEVSTNDTDIVAALRAKLAEKVGRQRFELWFGPSTRLELDHRALTIGVPNRFFLDWIRSSFRGQIESACFETLGNCPAIEFHVDATLPDTQAQPMQPAKSNGTPGRPKTAFGVVSADDGGAPQRPGEGSPGGSPRRRFASLGSFVEGHPNRLALASAQMVAREPGKMTPLLIHGPTSVGKTHLLEGVFSSTRKKYRKLAAIYLSAEQFTTYFLEALRGSGLPNFRRKYRGLGLLVLDDLQFFAGKRATQVELLHTVDTLLRQQRQVVFSADRPPVELAKLAEMGPELITRLQGGMVCRIGPADYATRLGIVAQLTGRMKLSVPPEVQRFIASRLTNHARELSGALCRLQATSEAIRRPITLPMAEEALAEMVRHSGRVVRLGDIEKAVCDVFGVDSTSLHSARKARSISHPRMLAMWLARKHTRAALSEIGHFFGRRSHSTVLSAAKRVDGWMAAGKSLDLAERSWDVDEAIRQVERQLLAG